MRPLPASVRAFLLAGCMLTGPTVAAADPSSPQDLSARVEEYMAARLQRDKFSGTVLIARAGQVIFCQGYGMANLELDVACSPQTKFRLGSITKQFTAMAILILQERGKLNVSDEIKKYIPDTPKAWDEITIHHLLTHTSGIPNVTSFPDFLKTLPNRVTLKELIAKFKDKPLEFKPGEKFKYSNSGYILLGQIIETVSGKPYASFLKDAIFVPLQMHDSGYDNAVQLLKHRASGYTRLLGVATANALYIDMSIPHAAGALYSTVEDLLKWDRALDSEKLVSTKSLEAMHRPFKNGYGYGWAIDRKFGQPRYEHGGGIPGFVTIIERFPVEKLLVVALSNLETSRIERIGDDLAAIALGQPYVVPREPKVVKLDTKLYDAYVGRYEGELADGKGKREITVSTSSGRLMIQANDQSKREAVPESETRFYLKAADGLVDFLRSQDGTVRAIEILDGNQRIKASRAPATAKAGSGEQTKPKTAGGLSKTREPSKVLVPKEIRP
jgi:CubicO group peptidase (beta-lactamase class C family)